MKFYFALLLVTLLFSVNISAIDSQGIEATVDALLQKNEITKLADELAGNNLNSPEDLLIKLSVFSRAGHRQRVLETFQQIGEIYSDSTEKSLIISFVKKYIDRNDFETQKIYYEKIAVNGDDYSRYSDKVEI